MTFSTSTKLNKRELPYVIADEAFPLADGKGVGYLAHDNVDAGSIEIFTQPGRAGERVRNFTVTVPEDAAWKLQLQVFAAAEVVYVSYESGGDTVEAEDINLLQQAAGDLAAALEWETGKRDAHEARQDNPHAVTKSQVGLDRVDNTADADKPVSTAQQAALDAVAAAAAGQLSAHERAQDNPHAVTKSQVGLDRVDNTPDADKPVSTAQQAALDAVATAAAGQLALHTGDAVRHITAEERITWGDKYTRAEVDNKFSAHENAVDWKESVDTYADLAATYPVPERGWTVNVLEDATTYRWNGTEWVGISANVIPKATTEVDGLLTMEDKALLDDAAAKRHEHGNKSVLDAITAALVAAWSSAVEHISDAVRHVTAAERTRWDTVTGKVDKVEGKGLSANDYTDAEKSKLGGMDAGANKYVHPDSHPADMIRFDDGDTFQGKLDAGELTGPPGTGGAVGPQGPKGDKGDTGATGPQGLKGDKGDTGAQGPQGLKGDKGDTGAQGPQGLKGDKGDTGAQGLQGPKGDKGDPGGQGLQGPKGDKGDTGATGPQGPAGPQGPSGIVNGVTWAQLKGV